MLPYVYCTSKGYAAATHAEIVNKVVARASPTESTGVPAMQGGKYVVVEYSELGSGSDSGSGGGGGSSSGSGRLVNPMHTCVLDQK